MSIVKALEDGSVELRLMPGADKQPRNLILPEPSMRQLAEIHALVVAADDALPLPEVLPDDPTPEQITRANATLRDRTVKTYSEGSPHGAAMLAIVKMLTGEELTADDLPGAAMSPRTCNQLLNIFQAPLGG